MPKPPPLPALNLRITFATGDKLGYGKVRLLEQVRATGSIAAAAREMGMAYRRAWLLIESLNTTFREPVVTAAKGGKAGGGTRLTPFGEGLVERFRTMEVTARDAVADHLAALLDATAAAAPARRRSKGPAEA